MKNLIFSLFIFGVAIHTYAGQVIYKTMYVTNTIVQGVGQTHEAAEKDAISAVPAGYVRDQSNGPVIECTVSEEMLRQTDGEWCDTTLEGNYFRLTVPIVAASD